VTTGEPSDLAEAEAIRRTHIGHEASAKSIGSLHYLVVVLTFLGFITVIMPATNFEFIIRVGMARFVGFIVLFLVFAAINFALGMGLYGLKPWARRVEVILTKLSLLFCLLCAGGVAMSGFGLGTGVLLGLSVIPGYILFLMLSKKGSMVFSPEYRVIIQRTQHIKNRKNWIVKIWLIVFVAIIVFAIVAPFLRSGR